jgi:hypothetical protein
MTIFSPTRDKNEPDIIRALVAVGATVTKLHEPGVPDLLVGFRGRTFLLEVKGAAGKQGGVAHRTLTDRQQQWWDEWLGERPTIVRSVEEALTVVGVIAKQPGLYVECVEHGASCPGERCCCADKHQTRTYPRAKR